MNVNLQSVIANEEAKTEARRRRAGRLRTVAESNNGNLAHIPLTPAQFFEAKYPGVTERYGAPVREEVDKNETISVVGINEAFFAAALGAEGSPVDPTIYARIEGRFYQYSPEEGIFKIVSDGALAARLSKELLEGARACKGGNTRTDNLEFTFRDNKKILGIVNTAKGVLEVPYDFFHGNPKELIAVHNGVLRLSDNALLPHGPQYHFRNKLAVSFDPSATCPGFLRFMHEALEVEDIQTVQKWFGQALTGENVSQKIIVLLGLAGTGKTTIIKILKGVIGGDNFAMLRTNLLTERFELSRFWAKTLLYAPDVAGDFLNHKGAAVLKSLSGHDPMTVEFKNSNETPQMIGCFNLILTCNSQPMVRLDGDSEAWRRRLVLIRFQKPKPQTVIADLDQRILEQESAGILNWALEGLAKLRADGWQLHLTSTQQEAVDNLLLESDGHTIFIREELVKDEDAQITSDQLFAAYADYCFERGWLTISRHRFGQQVGDLVTRQYGKALRKDIPDPETGKAQRGWRGLALKANDAHKPERVITFDDPERQRGWNEWEGTYK